ncbi:MAG: HlyD family efflux transporter periplasmic adaptor subunit [Armatimonadetes bacterium]|nr:HlyD family efflux transporter periplasmic adaptor subunit [Armatimonadota bacterium]
MRRLEVLHKHGGIADVDLSGARTKAAMARAGYDAASAAHDLAVAAAKPAAEAVIPRRQVSEADVGPARSGVKLASDGLRLARSARSEALAIADHDIEAARAQTAQAQAGLRQARAAIGDATLTSPIHGIVTKLTADAGEYAQPGMALMRIVSPASRRHVEVAVPVRLVGALAVGMRAQVHPGPRTAPSASLEAAGDGMPMRAVVSEISPVAASDGRSVTVRLRLLDGDAAARPGAMVGVTVDTGRGRASGRR